MIKRYIPYALTVILCTLITSVAVYGGPKTPGKRPVIQSSKQTPEVRALAIGLENGLSDLEILDANLQSTGKLSLREFNFSKPITLPSISEELRFGIADGIDENGKTIFRLVASIEWNDSYKKMCLLFLPKSRVVDGENSATDYSIQLLDMSTDSFKLGHTQIINLTPYETKIRMGEHNASVAAGNDAQLPIVNELNSLNMTPVEVSYIKEGMERNAYQTKMRYLKNTRYIAIAYSDPENERVSIRFVKNSSRAFK
ncbi:MAG: hypothetical protein ACSHYA_12025 [Opitutaceae bacterium]